MIIGSKIKEKRIALGLSQEQLGQKLGVSKVSICGYENGTRTPTMQNFIDIMEILGLTPDDLLGREVKVISEKEEQYKIYVSKLDLQLLKELKKHGKLYNKIMQDPARSVELIDRLYK